MVPGEQTSLSGRRDCMTLLIGDGQVCPQRQEGRGCGVGNEEEYLEHLWFALKVTKS